MVQGAGQAAADGEPFQQVRTRGGAKGIRHAGDTAAATGAERGRGLAGEVVLRQERAHHVRKLIPPHGRSQVHHIVALPIFHRRSQRGQVALVLLALHLDSHSVVFLVGRLDAEQVGARRFAHALGHGERVARTREHRHERLVGKRAADHHRHAEADRSHDERASVKFLLTHAKLPSLP